MTNTHLITDRTWRLREVELVGGTDVAVADLQLSWVRPTLELDADGSFNLLTGTRGRAGTYEISGSTISFDVQIVSSDLLVDYGSNEWKVTHAMAEVVNGGSISHDADGRLTLTLSNGDKLLFD